MVFKHHPKRHREQWICNLMVNGFYKCKYSTHAEKAALMDRLYKETK